jgi:hypothetical protein
MNHSYLRSKPIRTILKVVALLFLPILGYTLANVLYQRYSEGTFVKWRSLGKPSQGVVNIVGGNPWTVWWEGIDGQIYEGDIDKCRKLEEGCWRNAGAIDPYYYSELGTVCNSSFNSIRSLPGEISKCFTVHDLSEAGYSETNYALLQDGSIWYWKFGGSGIIGLFGFYSCFVCGGIFIGLILFIRMMKPKSV